MTTVVWEDDEEAAEAERVLLARENANGVPISAFAGSTAQVLDRWGDTWTNFFQIQAPGFYVIGIDGKPVMESDEVVRLHNDSIVDFRWPGSGLAHDYYQHAREIQLRAHA